MDSVQALEGVDRPDVERQWLVRQRTVITEYLGQQEAVHGGVAAVPDWFVAPYVSIWRVMSGKRPTSVGWWAIAGDLPTDYLSSLDAADARAAMREFAVRWKTAADSMLQGEQPTDMTVGCVEEWPALAPLLMARAALLSRFADDDSVWLTEAG